MKILSRMKLIHSQLKLLKFAPITIFFSFLGILLSQLPPLPTYFMKPNMELSIDMNNLSCLHDLGSLIFNDWIQIKNTGKSSGIITCIDLYLEKVDNPNYRKLLRASSIQKEYRVDIYNREIVEPVFDIYIKEGSTYYGRINFTEIVDTKCALVKGRLYKEIYQQIYEQQNSDSVVYITTLTQKCVDSITNESLQHISEGDYRFIIVMKDENEEIVMPETSYHFTMYRSDIETLKEQTKNYYTGGNNIWYQQEMIGFYSRLRQKSNIGEIKELIGKYKELAIAQGDYTVY